MCSQRLNQNTVCPRRFSHVLTQVQNMRRLYEPKFGAPEQNKRSSPERKIHCIRTKTHPVVGSLGAQTRTSDDQDGGGLLPNRNSNDDPLIGTQNLN